MVHKRRTSPIWTTPKKELQEIIDKSCSYREVLSSLSLVSSGSSVAKLKERIAEDGLNVFGLKKRRKEHLLDSSSTPIPLERILVPDSNYNRQHLKRRLIEAELLLHQCYECKRGPEWQGKPLSLHLDHINGVNNDNRLENLRLLCPNCHSQTPTYAGRKNRKPVRRCRCGAPISKRATNCWDCAAAKKREMEQSNMVLKDAELRQRAATGESYSSMARAARVSASAIYKRCKKLGIYVNRP